MNQVYEKRDLAKLILNYADPIIMFCAAVDRFRNVWRGNMDVEKCLNQNLLYRVCCWTRDLIIHEVGIDSLL